MTKSLHSERYQELLIILRTSREDAGLTQAEVANRLGKPQSYVSKVERGERRIDVLEFIDFIEASDRNPSITLATLREITGKLER